jgi:hypothetical protein
MGPFSDRVKALALAAGLTAVATLISTFVASDFTPYLGVGLVGQVASIAIAWAKSEGVDYIVEYIEFRGYDIPGYGSDVDGDGKV